MQTTFLDKAIGWISPRRGLERATARAAHDGLLQAKMVYEAATVGRRSEGWRATATDANAEITWAGDRLRNVARDMGRNNPHATRIKQVIAHNVVGIGIIPSAQSAVKGVREQLEVLMKDHFETTACDADGIHDLYGLTNLAMQTIVESGEVLIRMRPRRPQDLLPVPMQLQVLEPDFLDSSKHGPMPGGTYAINGIEFSPIGKRIAYWLFKDHPGGNVSFTYSGSVRVPAEYVAHVYRADRPGQVRGVTWFAPVIVRMRDKHDFSDAQLMRQKIAACFGAFITQATPDVSSSPLSTVDGSPYPVEQLGPGMVQRLAPGESVSFGDPPKVDGYADYMRAVDREIAAGMGVSYEAMTGDLSGVNFSSGRMGWLEFQRSISAWQNHMLMPLLCHRVGNWFLDAAALQIGRRLPAKIMWTPPRREMIDPSKETAASINAIRGGLTSRSNEVRKLGFEPADLETEIARDNKAADDLKLTFDSDARRMSQAGQVQVVPDKD
jgi:lambda family phage portal protein